MFNKFFFFHFFYFFSSDLACLVWSGEKEETKSAQLTLLLNHIFINMGIWR